MTREPLNAPLAAAIQAYVTTLAPVPKDELEAFLPCVAVATFRPGEFLTRVGDTDDQVGLVVKGIFRVYYLSPEGKAHVRNFCREGMPLGSYATILQNQPAHVNIEAISDAVVVLFSYSELVRRFDRHAAWERLGRRIAEEHYIARERREYEMMALDASARYELFLQENGDLKDRITQANLASYLDVTPETLSRLNRRRKQ